MASEQVNLKDKGAKFDAPIETGDSHKNRPADKKNIGDMKFDSIGYRKMIEKIFKDVPNLSENFFEEAAVIFESAVAEKAMQITESQIQKTKEELVDTLDNYLNVFVEEYLEKNQVAIETGIKNQVSETVLESVANIIKASGVTIPEEQIDIAESLISENEVLVNNYNKLFTENQNLHKLLIEKEKQQIFEENTRELSELSKSKLFSLMENIQADTSEEYLSKLNIIKQSITENKIEDQTSGKLLDNIKEDEQGNSENLDPKMQAYLRIARGSYYK